MIVGDLLRLEDLRIEVAWATPDLLDREVTGVTSTDLQDPARYLRQGELVLTGLVWWRPDDLATDPVAAAQAAGRFATALRSAEAAALLAGEGTHGTVPPELADACRRHGIPLLTVPAGTSFRAVTDRVYLRLWGDLQHQAEGTAAVPAAVRRDLLTLLHAGAEPSAILARAVSDLGLPPCSLRTTGGRLLATSEPEAARRGGEGTGRASDGGTADGHDPGAAVGGRVQDAQESGARRSRSQGAQAAVAPSGESWAAAVRGGASWVVPVGEPGVTPFDGWLLQPHVQPAPAAAAVLRGLAELLAPLAARARSTSAAQRQGAARVVDLLRAPQRGGAATGLGALGGADPRGFGRIGRQPATGAIGSPGGLTDASVQDGRRSVPGPATATSPAGSAQSRRRSFPGPDSSGSPRAAEAPVGDSRSVPGPGSSADPPDAPTQDGRSVPGPDTLGSAAGLAEAPTQPGRHSLPGPGSSGSPAGLTGAAILDARGLVFEPGLGADSGLHSALGSAAELGEALRSCGLPEGTALTPVVARADFGPAAWAVAALAEALQETGAPFVVAPADLGPSGVGPSGVGLSGVGSSGIGVGAGAGPGGATGLCAAPEAVVLGALRRAWPRLRDALAAQDAAPALSAAAGPCTPPVLGALRAALVQADWVLAARPAVSAEPAGSDALDSLAALLRGVPGEVRAAYRDRLLGPLLAHDRVNSISLLHTLAVFLELDGSWSRAARVLHVHVNTVHYRVRRIEELTGRNLARLEDRTDLRAALLCGPTGRTGND